MERKKSTRALNAKDAGEPKVEKRIEVVTLKVKDIGSGFGNPRKLKKPKRDELNASLENYGDFGIIVVDENNDVISGNQRLSVLREKDDNTEVLCKRLIGYTKAEKRAINIKANTHSGEWDLDLLADWTADLNLDLGIDLSKNPQDKAIKEMELLPYEKYDYVMVVCRTTADYEQLQKDLGIANTRIKINDKKKIKCRAIWYDKIKDNKVLKAKDGK